MAGLLFFLSVSSLCAWMILFAFHSTFDLRLKFLVLDIKEFIHLCSHLIEIFVTLPIGLANLLRLGMKN